MSFSHFKRHEIVEIIHDYAMLLFSDEAEDVAWWHCRGKVAKRWGWHTSLFNVIPVQSRLFLSYYMSSRTLKNMASKSNRETLQPRDGE